MLSINLKMALVLLLMQNSCSSFDVELAKQLLSDATKVFIRQKQECQRAGGTAIFISQEEKITCR
ncbi:MAG: hypothetical protein V4628_10545 [Pseudomonadota bacterium]